MTGKSPLWATQGQQAELTVLAGSRDRGEADRARAVLLTIAGWTSGRIAEAFGVRFVAANQHPDHATIAAFRRANKAAFGAAFLQVLLLARESGLLRLGTVSIDGTRIDANGSKIRSIRYDRAKQLRAKLAADIADLTAKAGVADAENDDPQALPAEIARREALAAKLDAACARLEAEARAEATA